MFESDATNYPITSLPPRNACEACNPKRFIELQALGECCKKHDKRRSSTLHRTIKAHKNYPIPFDESNAQSSPRKEDDEEKMEERLKATHARERSGKVPGVTWRGETVVEIWRLPALEMILRFSLMCCTVVERKFSRFWRILLWIWGWANDFAHFMMKLSTTTCQEKFSFPMNFIWLTELPNSPNQRKNAPASLCKETKMFFQRKF